MSPALRLLLDPVRFVVSQLYRMGQIGWHWQFDNPNDLYRRRNRLTYSRTPGNAAWLKTRSSVGASAEVDPDGYPAVKLIEDTTAANNHYLLQSISPPLGQTHGAWFDVKAGERTRVVLVMFALASSECVFDLSTGALVSKGASASAATITSRGGGWYRVFATWPTITAGTGAAILLDNGTTSNYTGDGVSGVHVSKAHFEYGATVAPEYQDVPTTWAQAYLDAVGAERIYAWTDTAGTTPVTAIGDGIGLLLGREYGGVRGPNLLADLDFQTGWTPVSAGSVVSANSFASGTGGGVARSLMTVGRVYELSFDFSRTVGGTDLRAVNALSGATPIIGTAITATTGSFRTVFLAAAAGLYFRDTVNETVTITNAVLREIPGTHLIQATGTAKPTLSARVNIGLSSEDISVAGWTKTGATTSSTTRLVENSASSVHALSGNQILAANVMHRVRFEVRPQGRTLLGVATASQTAQRAELDLSGAGSYTVVGSYPSASNNSVSNVVITALPDGYYLCQLDLLATSASTVAYYMQATTGAVSYLGDGASGMDFRKFDVRTSDDAAKNIPAYQRVGATASDHDTDGFPHYAEGDGSDNCWASVGTVDGSATDKLTVVAAVTKNSDAAAGIVLEHTTTSGNAGSSGILAPSSPGGNNFRWYARGVSVSVPEASANTIPAPATVVFTGESDLSADLTVARVGGVQTGSSSTDAGTGNFANATLYVLSRAGASARFNGRFYGSTGRFGPMSDSERNNLTRWWQKRIGTA